MFQNTLEIFFSAKCLRYFTFAEKSSVFALSAEEFFANLYHLSSSWNFFIQLDYVTSCTFMWPYEEIFPLILSLEFSYLFFSAAKTLQNYFSEQIGQIFEDLSDLYGFDLFFIMCWRMPSLCNTSICSSDSLSNTSSVIVMSLNSTAWS